LFDNARILVKNSYISRESLRQPLSVKKYFFLLSLSWTSMLSGSKEMLRVLSNLTLILAKEGERGDGTK